MKANQEQARNDEKIRHSPHTTIRQKQRLKVTMPKQPTARMKIINGRPYYYAIEYLWDKRKQRCHQINRYLGKGLPRGYRLIK
jgi:hypothetical protein